MKEVVHDTGEAPLYILARRRTRVCSSDLLLSSRRGSSRSFQPAASGNWIHPRGETVGWYRRNENRTFDDSSNLFPFQRPAPSSPGQRSASLEGQTFVTVFPGGRAGLTPNGGALPPGRRGRGRCESPLRCSDLEQVDSDEDEST